MFSGHYAARDSGHKIGTRNIHGRCGGGRYCMLPGTPPGRGHCRGGLRSGGGGRPIVVCGPVPLTYGTVEARVLLCRT